MQSENRLFDDFVKMMNGAAGTLAGMGREAEASFKERAKEWIAGMDFVSREEFDAVKDMAARARERSSRAQKARIAAELGPQVRLQGQLSYGAVSTYNFDRTQTLGRAQVVVEMPLFTSGLNEARVREASRLNDADWRQSDQTLRDIRQQVADSWQALVAARSAIGAYRASAIAAQRAYEGAEIQQRAGDRSTKEVLDLARDMLDARSNLASAQASEYINAAKLLAAMGQLDLAALVPDAAMYNAEAEFNNTRHKGDAPPVTQVIRLMDGVLAPSNKKDKPSRDPAAKLRLPIPATPATVPPADDK